MLVSAHPDYAMTHRLVPLTPGETWIECSWYSGPFAPNEDAVARLVLTRAYLGLRIVD